MNKLEQENVQINVDYLDSSCLIERQDAHTVYNTKIVEYGEYTDYIYYDFTIMTKKQGVEKHKREKYTCDFWLKNENAEEHLKQIKEKAAQKKETLTVSNANKEISKKDLLKSSRTLYQYAYTNASEFKSFITLTFKENITDIEQANKKFNIWVTKVRKVCNDNNKQFMYLGVPEFQKRGAVHYHLLTNLSVEDDFIIKQQEKKENMYDVKYWSYGFTSVFDLQQMDDKFNCAKYIAKYFFKYVENRMFGHKKILKSNNLKKPIVTKRLVNDFLKEFIIESYIDDIETYYNYDNMVIHRVRRSKNIT